MKAGGSHCLSCPIDRACACGRVYCWNSACYYIYSTPSIENQYIQYTQIIISAELFCAAVLWGEGIHSYFLRITGSTKCYWLWSLWSAIGCSCNYQELKQIPSYTVLNHSTEALPAVDFYEATVLHYYYIESSAICLTFLNLDFRIVGKNEDYDSQSCTKIQS